MSDLREKVAMAMKIAADDLSPVRYWYTEADAAIAIVLEEAAKVADEYQHPAMALYPHSKGIAVAIRALGEKA